MSSSIKDRYPLNEGDFYINDGECISCGAPQVEAPDLIEHGRSDGHCFFKKQPQTESELDQAINALMVSCIGALRYGGIEEKILKRLYEDGLAELCDHMPQQKYAVLVRDKVSFKFDGLIEELVNYLVAKYVSIGSHVSLKILTNDGDRQFSFVKRWTGGGCSLIYSCNKGTADTYTLQISVEAGKRFEGMIGTAAMLHDFLKLDNRIREIKWFAQNMPLKVHFDKPY